MAKKCIFIGIGFGTSVRDVLRNDTFYLLKQQRELNIVIFSQDIESEYLQSFKGSNVSFEKLISFKPTLIERILLNIHRATLREKCRTIDLGNTSGDIQMLDKFTKFVKPTKKLIGYRRLNKIISFSYKYFTKPILYHGHFKKYKPDLVIVTRVLNYSLDYPLMKQAVNLGVPVISLVSSWDNLTSKAFFPFSLDKLVVWNNVLAREAIELFDFPKEKIFISGIPRYDIFFRRTGFRDKISYFRDKNLDITKKLIVYATGSSTTGVTPIDFTSPESQIVKFIVDNLKNNNINADAQLLVRLHPQSNLEQYKHLANLPNVILDIPGKKSLFQDRLFSEKDDIELGETMLYADVVINMASTITIDAAVFDTPVICVNFDFGGEREYKYSIKRFYEFDHYAKLALTNGFVMADSKEELINQINMELKHPERLKKGRENIVSQQCYFSDGYSGKRIAEFIMKQLQN